ncbi:N-formylglutamate amidohydrolase [Labrys okinawensis]|uniref:N-formylglutamate amidohydrolase n=1 Tax=Labrys okinawensis TaxID=346911 RepID=A0A2S9QC98_9HYPH|nr:N-formylglutamate amidohydrolase [Labrys okinawensis]PRH86972.1 N-formylglutamate amidohydrolase [Labrys okinawensis]
MTSPLRTSSIGLLTGGDPPPVGLHNGEASSPFLIICDHAGNAVPAALAGLGLPQSELDRHIGVDIGILGVSKGLSDHLQAPLIFQRYSRLVAECNRRLDSPSFMTPISDGTLVPANQDPAADDRQARIREIVEPYHAEISGRIDHRLAAGLPLILVSMHSFTPSLRAAPAPRPWHIGLCYHHNRHFSDLVLDELAHQRDLVIGRNEPYGVNMAEDYSVPVHGEERRLPYVEFEIRQDLIADASGQAAWAERLAPVLSAAHARLAMESGR